MLPKPPKQLRALTKFLKGQGFILALPFDNIREPGYIGTYNQLGQEVIVDDGKCLAKYVKKKPANIVLGDFKKSSNFSIKGFFNLFGGLFGLNFSYQGARSVAIRFPRRFIPSEYITIIDFEEDWHKLPSICKKKLSDASHFLIVQTIQTDAIVYEVKLKKKLGTEAKLELENAVKSEAKKANFTAEVNYDSEMLYSIIITNRPMTIGYKRYTISVPLDTCELS